MADSDDEELFEALDAVLHVLERGRDRVDVVATRAAELRVGRAEGLSYADLITGANGPLVLDVLSELLDGLFDAGSRLRRAEVRALHADGLSMDKIGRLLGVSRQRVSTLINSPFGQRLPDRERSPDRRTGLPLAGPEFRLLAESLPHLIWVADPDGATEYFNEQGLEYTGLPREASDGWNWVSLVHPEDQEAALRGWRRATATGSPFEVEYRIRRADGVYRWHLCRTLPVRGRDGRPVKWLGTATDVEDYRSSDTG